MELLLKNATIIRSGSKRKTKKDILIKNGVIQKIANTIKAPGAKKISSDNLHVSAGWLDIGTQIGEPGYEHRENLDSISEVAVHGGFTGIACFPNTYPVLDNKSALQFIQSSTAQKAVSFYPIAALSKKTEGEDISEMMDLKSNGAVAFSDGSSSIQNSGILLRALKYVKAFNGSIIQKSVDLKIANGGQVHEGPVSIQLGLKGIPSIAETSSLQKDLDLNRYAESKITFHTISTEGSYKTLKEAKKNKDEVLVTVSYLNLVSNDEAILKFESNYKVDPPLRSVKDQNALIKGIKDGTIDAICSNHVPLEEEKKKMEFSNAAFGAIGLQTVFPVLWTQFKDKIDLSILCKKLSEGPRAVIGLEPIKIKVGEKANLTLFDPSLEWTYNLSTNKSKSKNSPYIGKQLSGKVLGIINGKSYSLVDNSIS